VVLLGLFCLTLLASSALEALRFYAHSLSSAALCRAGLPAKGWRVCCITPLGFDGATIFLLLAWGIGFSLFSGRFVDRYCRENQAAFLEVGVCAG
jgi:hypothetical protein